MLEKITETLKRFVGFVGASLTGITAIITATGFLAVRARLATLGLSSSTFDLEQYLETGARFLAFLPIYLSLALLSGLYDGAKWLMLHAGWLLLLLALFVLWGVWRVAASRQARLKAWREGVLARRAKVGSALWQFAYRRRALFLILFLFVQLLAAFQLTQALQITNLMFEPAPQPPAPRIEMALVGTEDLVCWMYQEAHVKLDQYLGWLFLVTILTVWGLRWMLGLYRRRREAQAAEAQASEPQKEGAPDAAMPPDTVSFWQMTWIIASLMLFVSQVTLLPINYGILRIAGYYPEVTVTFAEAEVPAIQPPPEDPLVLIHETGNGYYFYAREARKIWFVLRSNVMGLQQGPLTNILSAPRAIACPDA